MYTYMLLYYVKLFWYTILMQWQCFLLCFMIDWIWCYPKLDAWYNNQIYIYIYIYMVYTASHAHRHRCAGAAIFGWALQLQQASVPACLERYMQSQKLQEKAHSGEVLQYAYPTYVFRTWQKRPILRFNPHIMAQVLGGLLWGPRRRNPLPETPPDLSDNSG